MIRHEGELRICNNRNGSLGAPTADILSRHFGRSKAMWPPQLGPMAAQAQYSLAFLSSSHMRREIYPSNLHWLRYSLVWQIIFVITSNNSLTPLHPTPSWIFPRNINVSSFCPKVYFIRKASQDWRLCVTKVGAGRSNVSFFGEQESCLENGQGFAKPEIPFNVLIRLPEMPPHMWDATSRRENCACVIIETVAWGPRRQLLGRGFTVRKQCDPPQLGPMAAQAQYSLVSLNSSHMRREKWTSNPP